MEITVVMPSFGEETSVLRLLFYCKREGEEIEVGDKLFAYEADGALMYEHSLYRGRIELLVADEGSELEQGRAVMLLQVQLKSDGEVFFGTSEDDIGDRLCYPYEY